MVRRYTTAWKPAIAVPAFCAANKLQPMPPDTHSPTPVLLAIGSTLQDAQALVAALRASGFGGVGSAAVQATACLTLVQQVADAAPQQVIAYLPRGVADLLPALTAWQGQPPCPVSVVMPDLLPAQAEALAAAGVAAWCGTLEPDALRATLAFAQARHAREQTLRQELAAARSQIDERKWVDRAKGLLMAARNIAEDEAFDHHRPDAADEDGPDGSRVGSLEHQQADQQPGQWRDWFEQADERRQHAVQRRKAADYETERYADLGGQAEAQHHTLQREQDVPADALVVGAFW